MEGEMLDNIVGLKFMDHDITDNKKNLGVGKGKIFAH
jgi:hypothetical protein